MKIAVLPGDGIGPEIVAQAVQVLETLRADGLKVEMEWAPMQGRSRLAIHCLLTLTARAPMRCCSSCGRPSTTRCRA
jgi:isocitrate/isopropylmalate dehydrogenase